jgi:hypothetical protein
VIRKLALDRPGLREENLMQTQKSKIFSAIMALFTTILPWPDIAGAQQPTKVPRIGYLTAGGSPNDSA